MPDKVAGPDGSVLSEGLGPTAGHPWAQFARSAVMREVEAERERQDTKWGGAAHDDHHSTAEFVQLIEDYAGWARTMAGMDSHDKAERRLIQVAALAVAAVESSRRRRGA